MGQSKPSLRVKGRHPVAPLGGRTERRSGGEGVETSGAESGHQSRWETITVTDLTVATEVLDQLENQGGCESELQVLGERCFLIRWKSGP